MTDPARERWQAEASEPQEPQTRLADALDMLDDITRLTSDWIWSLDADFRLTFISDRIMESCGIPAAETIGRALTDIGKFVSTPDFTQPFRDQPFMVEVESGCRRHLLVSGVPTFSNETEEFSGARGTARDITETKKAEEISSRLVAAIEDIPEVFFLHDADDRLVVANSKYRQLNQQVAEHIVPGVSFEEHVGAIVRAGLIPEALGNEEAWIRERVARHRNPSGTFELSRQNGRHYLIQEHRLPDGSTASFAVDITHRREMEEALRESMRRQWEFATDVAHELRTPIAVLRANLDHFDESREMASLKDDVDSISRMVEQLLTESRLINIEIAPEETADLAIVSRSVAEYLGPLAIRLNRSIEVKGADRRTPVWGRAETIEQALRNLVENAIKFTPSGTTVAIEVTSEPGLRVIDHGPGVPADLRDKVFTRYLRADRRGMGAGIGLAIVRRIADAHGASVGVETAANGGASFFMKFPSLGSIVGVAE